MGNDLSRGMLLLGKGEKLGKSGLDWLKIHCANLMGKDKATIPEKIAFIQDNIDLINAMGKDPLKNR
jgi:DNA-directed RNA polymerase